MMFDMDAISARVFFSPIDDVVLVRYGGILGEAPVRGVSFEIRLNGRAVKKKGGVSRDSLMNFEALSNFGNIEVDGFDVGTGAVTLTDGTGSEVLPLVARLSEATCQTFPHIASIIPSFMKYRDEHSHTLVAFTTQRDENDVWSCMTTIEFGDDGVAEHITHESTLWLPPAAEGAYSVVLKHTEDEDSSDQQTAYPEIDILSNEASYRELTKEEFDLTQLLRKHHPAIDAVAREVLAAGLPKFRGVPPQGGWRSH